MKPLRLLPILIVFVSLVAPSCKKESANPQPKSSKKSIDSVDLQRKDGSSLDLTQLVVTFEGDDTILLSVPAFTDITSMTPVIHITGIKVSPASGVKQDFSSPVVYTVTAADGSQKKYTVILSVRGVVYFGSSDDHFYAVDAVLGTQIWELAGGDFSYSDPTLVDSTIYAGCIDDNMYAINASTGTIRWTYKTDMTIESPPTVANGIVYFGNDAYHFYALDAKTGGLKWQFNAGRNISSRPVVQNGVVYFAADDYYVYALDAGNGTVKWKYQAVDLFNASSPAISNGVLYIGNRDGNLYALDVATGNLKWKCSTNGISLEMSRAIVSNGVVYIGGWYNFYNFKQAGSLYAIDAVSGTLNWMALDSLGIGSDPAVADGLVYITCDDGNIYGVDVNTHAVVWSTKIYANGASPTVDGGIVYCGGGGNHLFYAMDAKRGTLKWTFTIGNMGLMTSTPVVFGRTNL